jgi:hypothetical protein
LVLLLYIEAFVFEKYQNLNFWWYFKVPQANCLWENFGKFWQFGAGLHRFCYIGSGYDHAQTKAEIFKTF